MLRSNRRAAYTVVEARWRLQQLTELFEVSFDIRNCFFGQKQIRGALAGDIEDLRWALQKVKDGKLHPTLDRALPLKDAAEAHRLIAANHLTGSIALLPWAA